MRSLLASVLVVVGGVIASSCTSKPVSITVEGALGEMAIGEDAVWVVRHSIDGPAGVLRIDPKVKRVVATIPIAEASVSGGITVGEGGVWVAEGYRGRNVYRIDPKVNQVVATIPVGAEPGAVAVTTGAVWVAGRGAVHRIDPWADLVVATIPVGGLALLHVTSGYGAVWVLSTGGTVYRIDPQTNAIDATIPVARNPRLAIVGEGSVWVVHDSGTFPAPGAISRIDPHTNQVVGEPVQVGVHPHVAVGGGYLWVAGYPGAKGSAMARLDPRFLKAVGTPILIKPFVSRMVFGFDSVWVHSSLSSAPRASLIQRIRP